MSERRAGAGRHAAVRGARRRGAGIVAAAAVVAALATGGLAALTAGDTDAAFTGEAAGRSTTSAATIAAPSGVTCSSLLGIAVAAHWPVATPAAAAPNSYRYIVRDNKPRGTFASTAATPSFGLPANLLGLGGGATFAAHVELLRSGTPRWTGGTSYFRASTLLGTSCPAVTP